MTSCIYCDSERIVKNGKASNGEQAYRCKACKHHFTASSNPENSGSQFTADLIKLSVLWYYRYPLSYRNVAEMMLFRGVDVSHQSVYRWTHSKGSEMAAKARSYRGKKRTVSWYVDETYVKVKGEWKYLYRAVDRDGEVLDVMLSAERSKKAAKRFFRRTLKALGIKPERIYTDRNKAYPEANVDVLQAKHGILHVKVTPVERSHVPVKRRYSVMRGFGSFWSAFRFTRNFEYLRDFIGHVSNDRKGRIDVGNRMRFLMDAMAI